ncbi:uncharacterized protein LOC100185357 [Ciona intestinalis]
MKHMDFSKRKYSQGIVTLLFLLEISCLCQGAVSTCNAVLTGSSGTFTSPNYPRPPEVTSPKFTSAFPNNGGFVTCSWEIIVPSGKGIQLKFGDFFMAENSVDDCDKGEVEVFIGVGKTKSGLDTYCSGNNPDIVTLHNNTATVTFRRPSTFSGRGFLISYIAITPGKTVDDFVTCCATGEVRRDVGTFSVVCPAGCAGIYRQTTTGNLCYRDTSHLCLSAVHAGVTSDNFGGRVKVERQLSKVLYHGEGANNISSSTGGLSDSMVCFPELKTCHDKITFTENQLTASSVLNISDSKGGFQVWSPKKAMLTAYDKAWKPANHSTEQWIQVNLRRPYNITAILTKGSAKPYSWTKSYTIKYSMNNITWKNYKEEGSDRPKVFSGNRNYFAEVRNNFVRPPITAKYLRVYPTPQKQHEAMFQYGLKFGLLGCMPSSLPVPDPTPTPKTPSIILTKIVKTTTTPTTTKPVTTTPQPPLNSPIPNETTTVAPTNATSSVAGDGDNSGGVKDPKPNPGNGEISEKSIIIIAIVAALAVTSILLAALVLILVRKRKKEPKLETMVPTSQTNATYATGIDIRYPDYKYSKQKKKQLKKEKKKNKIGKFEIKNVNYKDSMPLGAAVEQSLTMANSRGGITLRYDQQQRQSMSSNDPLMTSCNGAPLRSSYVTNDVAGTSNGIHAGSPILVEEKADSFITDDEDHEYQVIPDNPPTPTPTRSTKASSKASTGSSIGNHSRQSDSMPWPQVWGNAGDAWGKDGPSSPIFIDAKGGVTSFTPHNRPQRSRAGTFPHPLHYGVENGIDSMPAPPKTAPPNSTQSFTAPRFHHRKRGGSKSPPNATTAPSYYPPQRYSSSSGSSSHSHFDSTSSQRHNPASTYYSSVPEYDPREADDAFLTSNGHQRGMGQPDGGGLAHTDSRSDEWPPGSDRGRKPSYNYPSNIPVSQSAPFSTLPSNGLTTNGGEPINGSVRRSTSRSESMKQRGGGYDHLYRNKCIGSPDGGKSVVALTMNNYDQLDLNTPV